MSRTLYGFIDESGNPSSGNYYVVACCWCLSERNSPNEVLRSSLDTLLETAEDLRHNPEPLGELKSSSLPPAVLENLFEGFVPEIGYDDPTITVARPPWERAQPFRYSIHSLNPDVGNEILRGVLGNHGTSVRALKTLSLASVLNPVFVDNRIDNNVFDDLSVVLDADVWKGPAESLKEALDIVDVNLQVEFRTMDSRAVPGLQMADLGAYTWARHMRSGDCERGAKTIHNLRFSQE